VIGLDPALGLAIRLFGALLFGLAALHKLRRPTRFRAALAGYRLLPPERVATAARALPAVELAVAGALLVAPGPVAGGLGLGLLALYSAAIARALRAGPAPGDCGCGPGGRPVPLRPALLTRNALCAAGLALLLLPETGRPLTPLDAATAFGGALTLALLHAAVEELLALPLPEGVSGGGIASRAGAGRGG